MAEPKRLGSYVTAVTITVAVVVVASWLVVEVPRRQASGVKLEGQNVSERTAALIDQYRRTVVQVVGGIFVVIGGLSGAFFTGRQISIAREGQITDRFMKAIGLLGDNDKLAMRLGGVYALERIARDSPKDQWTVVETLAAFIRERAVAVKGPRDEFPTLRLDLQAALTVLARRNRIAEPGQVDLHDADLATADLRDGWFKGANFYGARLEQAQLVGAHLEEAFLLDTHLEGAWLQRAHLQHAFLQKAHLEGAALHQAHLEDASLQGAHLEDATLEHARLDRANLYNAHLERAILWGASMEDTVIKDAHLEGAEFRLTGAPSPEAKAYDAIAITLEQLRTAHVDATTAFPDGINLKDVHRSA